MKLKMLFLSFGLLFSMPVMASANKTVVPDTNGEQREKAPCDCQEGTDGHHMMHKNWQTKMMEREKMLLSWVDQYTPAKKEEWIKVLEEKKTLRNKWMSPKNAAMREQWKKDKMANLEALKKQFDEGKITKEEFMKQAHGGKEMAHWKTFQELKLSAEKKNTEQSTILLNQLLDQYKQHNTQINEIVNKQ
ncbi:MAG: hypothetical protein K6T88_08965 [Bacillus sp. (in: Bacteria)]|nr:hypothetical protein [Bacillus sp. (in: firmicutes)]